MSPKDDIAEIPTFGIRSTVAPARNREWHCGQQALHENVSYWASEIESEPVTAKYMLPTNAGETSMVAGATKLPSVWIWLPPDGHDERKIKVADYGWQPFVFRYINQN